jgi:pyridoxamine 5'-phosphate oxidase
MDTGTGVVDPIQRVTEWLDAARRAGEPLPDAMALATSTIDGRPSARMVMLRGLDHGLVFFTDSLSDKGLELESNPLAAVVLHWLAPAHRQVRASGPIDRVTEQENDDYWTARRPEARRAALAWEQSQAVRGRHELEERLAAVADRFPEGVDVPRPSRWRGYRLVPAEVELWQESSDGLHERVRYRRHDDGWELGRLSP